MFLKIKTEASGYPSWVKDYFDQVEYVRQFYEREGVLLDQNKIEKNPSLRFIAKLFLNSSWGKLAQNTSQLNKYIYVKDPAELTKMRANAAITVTDFHIINQDVIVIGYKPAATFEPENTFENEVHAIFTTASARLHLFEILEKVGPENVVYFDTDSCVFYETKEEAPRVSTGDGLGLLTDEVPPGVDIQSFVSSGPKSYCYRLSTGETVIKIKGFTLNARNLEYATEEAIRDVVLGNRDEITFPPSKQIQRVKHKGIVYNRPISKKYRKVFDKRVVNPQTMDTLPFGFRH